MSITSVRISGKQICDYIWVLNRELTNDEVAFVSDYTNEPSWTLDTELLVTFNESLLAGNITSGSSSPTNWKIYRQEVGDSNMVLAAAIDDATTNFIDYNIKNNTEYIYHMFAETASYITAPIAADPITTNWRNWCLFDVTETDEDNVYKFHEGFVFSADVQSGSMNNNLQSATYPNFTEFPKIHKGQSNFYSGTLQALLGRVECPVGKYIEHPEMEAALKAFTTNPRKKFLKDAKGHIWEVEITSALTVTPREGYPFLPYDISFGWTEIGTTDGLIITN